MPRRRQINAGSGRRSARSALAAASLPFRDLAGALEERVLWRLADLLRGAGEIVRWPFERLAWTVERRLLWPLGERAAGHRVPIRALGAGALAIVAAAAVAFGVIATSGGGEADPVETGAPLAASAPAPPPPKDKPTEPALQGVPPKFGVGGGVGVAATSGGKANGAEANDPVAAARGGRGAVPEEGDATTSSQKPVPAGPVAMKVARRFSQAFAFYEIGERPARSLAVFGETATPQLAAALAERPPRQPQSTDVPKARVLNLVPGPRSGGAYTVSASLLRVGAISELRLKMMRQNGAWFVTDVRG